MIFQSCKGEDIENNIIFILTWVIEILARQVKYVTRGTFESYLKWYKRDFLVVQDNSAWSNVSLWDCVDLMIEKDRDGRRRVFSSKRGTFYGENGVGEGERGDFWYGRVSYLQTDRARAIMSSRDHVNHNLCVCV